VRPHKEFLPSALRDECVVVVEELEEFHLGRGLQDGSLTHGRGRDGAMPVITTLTLATALCNSLIVIYGVGGQLFEGH